MNEALLSEKLIWEVPLWHEKCNEPTTNSCCICSSYICVSFSGLFNGLKSITLWLLDASEKGKDVSMHLTHWKVVGKVFKLLLELCFDEIMEVCKKGGSRRCAPLMQACMMLALFLACYWKVAYLDSKIWLRKMNPHTSGFYNSNIAVVPSPSVFTAGASVSHRKAVKHVLLYGEQRSYQLVLMLPSLITPLSQPCNLWIN